MTSKQSMDKSPDFYEVGKTYTYSVTKYAHLDWAFRCDAITTHPQDGERTALGWRYWRGSWEAYAYDEGDYEIMVAEIGMTQ